MVTEIDGNLITLAQEGKFDVVTHGCNCYCTMGAGIAPQMAKAFGADKFKKEKKKHRGKIKKLGTIDYKLVRIEDGSVFVVNSYTQFNFGKNHPTGDIAPVDYEAIRLCMRKINYTFSGKHVGLPLIGCGLAGGDWNIVKAIIEEEFTDCQVTIVHFKK